MDFKLIGLGLIVLSGVLSLIKLFLLKVPEVRKMARNSAWMRFKLYFPMYQIAGVLAFIGLVLIVWK